MVVAGIVANILQQPKATLAGPAAAHSQATATGAAAEVTRIEVLARLRGPPAVIPASQSEE